MKLFKRALPLCMALVLVLSAVAAPMTTVVSAAEYKPGQTAVQAATVSAETMHPFTSTADLIRDAIEELRAQNITHEEKEPDAALVSTVEAASGMTYDAVKNTIATDLKAGLSAGSIDVADLGLSKTDMTKIMAEVLNENYLYNAVTELSYTTVGGKVSKIGFSVSDGYAAAMSAMNAEHIDIKVNADAEAAQTALMSLAATPMTMAEGDEETTACTSHTVDMFKLGDYNQDGEVDAADARRLLRMSAGVDLGYTLSDRDDFNNDGEVDAADARYLLRKSAAGESFGSSGGDIAFTFVEAQDYSPVFRTDENGNYLDSDGNITENPEEAITNGGLLYNPEDGSISEGLLPNIYYKLTEISFHCSVCGEDIVLTDDPDTEDDELAQFSMAQDIYINLNTYETVACNVGETPVLAEGETEDDYLLYTEMQIGTYYDDTFSLLTDGDGNLVTDENGNPIPAYEMDAEGNPILDENGNVQVIGLYTSDAQDNGSAEVAYYYSVLSAFNADHADYFGVSADYWTSKNSEANPMAALKVLCNLDPNQDIPPAQMIQMVQMLPQAFMAYVYYYGSELLAMRDAAMDALDASGASTDVQKLLVIHDWLSENAVFDMGSMLNVSGEGASNDPIQMTTFGALLSNQLTEMQGSGYYGGICLAYAAAYTYLVQAAYPDIYMTEEQLDTDGDGTVDQINDVWCNPAQVDAKGGDIVDFSQVMFYADTSETSIAGEGFGGGAFNNVHYFNAVKLANAPEDPDAEDNDMTGKWFYVDSCYDDIYVECLSQYRAEADGSVYHSYFLVSPQTMGKLWADSIDYIDSPYDGYVYEIETDADGNQVPSDNIAEDSENYDATHPNYIKVESADETMNNNTCYEDSWFSGAVSKIYSDGTNWYYVDSGTNSASYADMMDENGEFDIDMDQMEENGLSMDSMMHSSRVSADDQDKMKSRPMSAPDYWEEAEDEDSTEDSMGFDMTTKEDTYATVLFDYGTGATLNVETVAEDLAAAVVEDFVYNEQFPGLTHTIGITGGTIYFNLGNQVWSMTTAGSAPTLFKEYNTVSATSDGRTFTASSYTLDAEGTDLTVENNPIAGLCVRTAYQPLYNYLDADGNVVLDYQGNPSDLYMGKLQSGEMTQEEMQAAIVGRQFVAMYGTDTMTVNIGTNYSYTSGFEAGMTDDEKTASTYTVEAINYNPDYSMGISDDSANNNEEFLWCANIREDVAISDWASSTGAEDKVPCTAQNSGHTYELNEEEGVYICSACHLHAVNIVGEVEHGTVTLTAIADSGMSEDFVTENGGSSEDVSTTTQPVSPEREAATTQSGDITVTVVPEEGYGIPAVTYTISGVTTNEDGTTAETTTTETVTLTESTEEAGTYVGTITKSAEGTVVVNAAMTDTANLTVADAANGTVTVDTTTPVVEDDTTTEDEVAAAADLSIAEGQTTAVAVGDTVTITATPDTGYEVGAVKYTYFTTTTSTDEDGNPVETTTPTDVAVEAVDGVYSFTMPAEDITLTVEFQAVYTVTVAETTNGTVTADPASANEGETVTLTVAPDSGYELDALEVTYKTTETVTAEDGTTSEVEKEVEVTVTDNTFVMPAANVTVTASFKAIVVEYDVTVNTAENGSVTASTAKAIKGTEITLTVAADDGYEVESLTVTDATGAVVTVTDNKFTMPASNVTVTATFKKTETAPTAYTVTVSASENGTVTADKATAAEGDTVTLTVTPNSTEYVIESVSYTAGENTTTITASESGVYSFVMPASDVTVSATFTAASTEGGETT